MILKLSVVDRGTNDWNNRGGAKYIKMDFE
jgi:hypothetical protein